MIVDYIILGLGSIIGFEVVLATMMMFTILLTSFSKALGTTSMITLFMFSVYLFSQYEIGDIFLIDNTIALMAFLVLGLFIGLMFYAVVVKE